MICESLAGLGFYYWLKSPYLDSNPYSHDTLPIMYLKGNATLKVLCFKVKNFTNNEFWHKCDQNW